MLGSLRQFHENNATTDTNANVFAATPLDGNLMVACIFVDVSTSISITGWTEIINLNFTGTSRLYVLAKTAASDSATVTSTNTTGAGIHRSHIYEFNGSFNPYATDGTQTASSAGATSLSTGNITPATPNCIIIAVAAQSGTNGGSTTMNNSFNQEMTSNRLISGERFVGSTAVVYNCTLGWTTSRPCGAAIVAFKMLPSPGNQPLMGI